MRRLLILFMVILMALILTTTMAEGINGDFNGYPIVNLLLNGVKLDSGDVPAISFEGSAMVPLNTCVEKMNGIVEWDGGTMTASILKPEISIYYITYGEDGKTIENVTANYPILRTDKKVVQIISYNGLPVGTYTTKFAILDQAGIPLVEMKDLDFSITDRSTYFVRQSTFRTIHIAAETYKVIVYMKDSSGDYKVVATKAMKYVSSNPAASSPSPPR